MSSHELGEFPWIHAQSSWRERVGLGGGEDNQDSRIMREWSEATGSVVMGRLMCDSGAEFWGDSPPFRPVFVLTGRPAPTLVKDGGTTFTFVTDASARRPGGPGSPPARAFGHAVISGREHTAPGHDLAAVMY